MILFRLDCSCHIDAFFCNTVMLDWFVSSRDANRAMNNGDLLEEESVEARPERVPNSCIDEYVNIFHIKKYFTNDAWKIVQQVLEMKKIQSDWFCKVCNKELEDTLAIACDSCLDWYHLGCAGLRKSPKQKEWFCRFCHEQASQEDSED